VAAHSFALPPIRPSRASPSSFSSLPAGDRGGGGQNHI
jgi:hypothetical protein